MSTFFQDLRYGVRILTKSPGVTLVAVLTLALGIGANSAIFSGVNAFLFRQLPVAHPERLARPAEITEGGISDEVSYPDYLAYLDQNTVFQGIAAEKLVQAALGIQDQNDVIWGQAVSGNYFQVLSIQPMLGRWFLPEEDKTPGSHPVVVIGHSLWTRRLGSDLNIAGKTIELNGRAYTVIGVAPEFFQGSKFGLSLDFWVPMMMVEELEHSPNLLAERGSHWMNMLARLKPAVSLSQASAEMSAIAQRLNQTYVKDRANTTRVVVLNEVEGRWHEAAIVIKSGAAIAMAIVGLVLLIACANVANLLLARAAARRKEIGIRLALGASRFRLLRQLLTESLLLAGLGGVLGLLLAHWATYLMQGFIPVLQYNIIGDFFALDSRALVFTLLISLTTGLVFGLAPAWHASNPDVVPVLKGDAGTRSAGKRRRLTLRNTLVVAQVALSLVVLVSAGLFIKSFRNAQNMDPGFEARNVLLLSLNPRLVNYDQAQTLGFYRRVLEVSSSLPGVEAVSLARLTQLGDSSNASGPILKEGEQLPPGSAGRTILNNVVSPGHFKTLEIPMLEGRDFDERDRQGAPRTVIVNERMAQLLWPGASAVGKRIFIGPDSRNPLEVVGVVKTGKYLALTEDPRPYYYYPMTQLEPGAMTLMVRTNSDPGSLADPIRAQVQNLDRRLPLFAVKTMTQHLTFALWGPRMAATLSLSFGLVALLLSAVGLYSVMAYLVSQRTREVGIRMALGARRRDVLKLITSDGMLLAGVGIIIGLGLAMFLVRVLGAVLIGVTGYDASTFLGVATVLALVALLASLVPARRATKVDPMVALRYE